LNEIASKIADAVKIINDSIPERIIYARKEIELWKEQHKKAIVSAKTRQFLYGALQQFDALQ
jgi:hypothetical protein